MTAVLVWVVVGYIYGPSGSFPVGPVPPMADRASCARVVEAVRRLNPHSRVDCVQVAVAK